MPYKDKAKQLAATTAWQKEQVANGRCMYCGKPRGESKNSYTCEVHRQYCNDLKKRVADERIAAGRCAECNEVRTDGASKRLCLLCKKKKQGLQNALRLRRKHMGYKLFIDD